MNKAVYSICSFSPYYYNVHIITDGYYCGIGRFCESWHEVVEFCNRYNVVEIKKQEGNA